MSNQPMPDRDEAIVARIFAGGSTAKVAAELGISPGRVSQILARKGLCGRVKEPGMPCISWSVRQEPGGAWLCTGGGIARRAKTPEVAVERWKAELARQRGTIVVLETPTPAPVRIVTGALRLSATMRHLAERAAAAQPPLLNMGSPVREGGVQ
jgi:hypothetical protein